MEESNEKIGWIVGYENNTEFSEFPIVFQTKKTHPLLFSKTLTTLFEK